MTPGTPPSFGDASSGDAASSKRSCLAIGVDGGGTKSAAWLAEFDDRGQMNVLGRGHSGASNPRAVGLETALANLAAAVDDAWKEASAPPQPVDAAVLALAGTRHASIAEKVLAWTAARGIAHRTALVHDAEPVLAAGTPNGWGVAMIVGTGSSAIAAAADGRREVVGGWGYWFGDEGSAYWIGRRALEAVARAADGRGPATALQAAVAKRLAVDDTRAILATLEKTGNVCGAIADLAEMVIAVAAYGDAVARTIVNDAASELAALVIRAADKLSLGRQFPLALAGGVACGSADLREKLIAALAARSITPTPLTPVPHPAEGCLHLAWKLLTAENCNSPP